MLEALDKLKTPVRSPCLTLCLKQAEQLMNEDQMEAYQEFWPQKHINSFAVKRRDSKNITSTLKESRQCWKILTS